MRVPASPIVPSAPAASPPDETTLWMAAAMMHAEGKIQLAGDVAPFPLQGRGIAENARAKGLSFEDSLMEYAAKTGTQNTLGRVLGRNNVKPFKPGMGPGSGGGGPSEKPPWQ